MSCMLDRRSNVMLDFLQLWPLEHQQKCVPFLSSLQPLTFFFPISNVIGWLKQQWAPEGKFERLRRCHSDLVPKNC